MAQAAIQQVAPSALSWESSISGGISLVPEQANGLKKVKSSTYQDRTAATQGVTTQDVTLQELFAENVLAKLWRVASRDLENNVSPWPPLRSCYAS